MDEATVASLIEQIQEQLDTGYATATVPPKSTLYRVNHSCRPVASSEFVTEISAALIVAHRCDVT